jgi:ketosteroid isomerase-like protein
MMHPNEKLIEKFYACFQKRDHQGMAACYHDEVEFSDAVFIGLKGARAKAMWGMLCERGKDLAIEVSGISADADSGKAHWEARYTFSATGRKVHNKIDAAFQFADGKIINHRDSFDLWKWARMAFGLKGILLGWLPAVQTAIRKEAGKNLESFMKKTA